MKKTVLASSIAAAVFGLGVSGAANAQSTFSVNAKGIGQILVVPYFSVQENNVTLLNLVNTDTTNGKAVKVRFRSAANSDDLFDFQLFLSPGDVWAANISKGADGLPVLNVGDTTCSKPATISGVPFVTNRLNAAWTTAEKANNSREGYIEIINMANVPPNMNTTAVGANPLWSAIKHTSTGTAPPCRTAATTTAAWTNLDNIEVLTADSPAPSDTIDRTTGAVPTGTTLATATPVQRAKMLGLSNATGGLMANWTIINTVGAAAWTGEAVAINKNANLFVNYFSQTDVELDNKPGAASASGDFAAVATYEDARTADPLFRRTGVYSWSNTNLNYAHVATGTANAFLVAPPVSPLRFDIPDLSTPVASGTTARAQAVEISQALLTTNFINEYITETSIGAKTDWVFSMPTRRYNIAMNYAAISTSDSGRRFTDLSSGSLTLNATLPSTATNFPYFTAGATSVNSAAQICVRNFTRSAYDREERIETATLSTVISPSTPSAPELFCGEVSVLSVNNDGSTTMTGALKASVAIKDLATSYSNGWMSLNLASGYPVTGFAAVRANGATNGQTYGATWQHRVK